MRADARGRVLGAVHHEKGGGRSESKSDSKPSEKDCIVGKEKELEAGILACRRLQLIAELGVSMKKKKMELVN